MSPFSRGKGSLVFLIQGYSLGRMVKNCWCTGVKWWQGVWIIELRVILFRLAFLSSHEALHRGTFINNVSIFQEERVICLFDLWTQAREKGQKLLMNRSDKEYEWLSWVWSSSARPSFHLRLYIRGHSFQFQFPRGRVVRLFVRLFVCLIQWRVENCWHTGE